MAEVLGFTISHHPYTRFKPRNMANVLKGNMERGWQEKPHLKDPANWPAVMRREWADDEGLAVAKKAQDHQIEVFRKLKAAVDAFQPDFILCLHRDQYGGRDMSYRPAYWIQAHESVDVQFLGPDNYFDLPPDVVHTVPGHREAALHIAAGLRDAGFDPVVFDGPNRLGAHAQAGVFHLDFDAHEFKTPVAPFALDPWRFGRQRNNEGLSKLDLNHPDPPLTAKQGFQLGRELAKICHASPWRVAMMGSTAWGGANSNGWGYERVHPNIENDLKLYEEWRTNRFDTWDRFTFQEFEEQGEWELLTAIVLAGAMTELGAKVQWSDFTSYYTLNSNWVSSVFDAR